MAILTNSWPDFIQAIERANCVLRGVPNDPVLQVHTCNLGTNPDRRSACFESHLAESKELVEWLTEVRETVEFGNEQGDAYVLTVVCLLYTSPSPRDS